MIAINNYLLRVSQKQYTIFWSFRTEVRGDFNMQGTKYFEEAVFHQKSKIYDVVSLLYLWLAKKPILSMKYWYGWLLLKMPVLDVFSNNQLCQYFMERMGFIGQPKVQEAYNIIFFWFLMENSIPKLFGSVDVKNTPDFSSSCKNDNL